MEEFRVIAREPGKSPGVWPDSETRGSSLYSFLEMALVDNVQHTTYLYSEWKPDSLS